MQTLTNEQINEYKSKSPLAITEDEFSSLVSELRKDLQFNISNKVKLISAFCDDDTGVTSVTIALPFNSLNLNKTLPEFIGIKEVDFNSSFAKEFIKFKQEVLDYIYQRVHIEAPEKHGKERLSFSIQVKLRRKDEADFSEIVDALNDKIKDRRLEQREVIEEVIAEYC